MRWHFLFRLAVDVTVFNHLHKLMAECFFRDIIIMESKSVEIKLRVNYHFAGEKLHWFMHVLWPEDADRAMNVFCQKLKRIGKVGNHIIVNHKYMAVMPNNLCQTCAVDGKGVHIIIMKCQRRICAQISGMLCDSNNRKPSVYRINQFCHFKKLSVLCNILRLVAQTYNIHNPYLVAQVC